MRYFYYVTIIMSKRVKEENPWLFFILIETGVMSMAANLRLDHVGEHRTAFEKNRKKIIATAQICGICGNPLDKQQKYPHPLSTVVDHIVPISRGGHPSDLQNLQAAHRWCNRQKSDKLFNIKGRFKEQEEVKSTDLPLHYNWQAYKAK